MKKKTVFVTDSYPEPKHVVDNPMNKKITLLGSGDKKRKIAKKSISEKIKTS